ncbi:hypothetical protein [Leifsonia aquatica]|uniref:hypothetical protein n=1 Tax=Leifsonia aquatica TaxID=144185 RepID=UPI0013B42D8B|nr:hypothetical protein [Leifsonia aquatica]
MAVAAALDPIDCSESNEPLRGEFDGLECGFPCGERGRVGRGLVGDHAAECEGGFFPGREVAGLLVGVERGERHKDQKPVLVGLEIVLRCECDRSTDQLCPHS